MAIPAFQSYLLPALQALGSGGLWSNDRMAEELSIHFKLSPEDKANLLPSGVRPRYRNRAIWALTYLFHAGLAQRPARGKYEITPAGVSLLGSSPNEITRSFLIDNYSGFRAFATQSSGNAPKMTTPFGVTAMTAVEQTPNDRFESAFTELRASLVSELLDRLALLSSEAFERAVLRLLRAMGYAADEHSV